MVEWTALRVPADAIRIDPTTRDRLPDSARRVLDAVVRFAPVTHDDLKALTGIPPRTIRYAVRRLRDDGILDSRCSLSDCRTCYFFVHPDCVASDLTTRREASVAPRV